MVIVSYKKLFIADINSGYLPIADTILRNEWQLCIKIYPSMADSHYSSRFTKKLECCCCNQNIERKYLRDDTGQMSNGTMIQLLKVIYYDKHIMNFIL